MTSGVSKYRSIRIVGAEQASFMARFLTPLRSHLCHVHPSKERRGAVKPRLNEVFLSVRINGQRRYVLMF